MAVGSLSQVVTRGMCTGCGVCASLGADQGIRMQMTTEGFLRPRIPEILASDREQALLAICPGSVVQSHPEQDLEAPLHKSFGRFHRIVRGHATDPQLRYVAATGGVLSGLALYLLERGLVDGVLQVALDETQPLHNVVRMSRDREDVLAAGGSRYGPAAPLVNIDYYLDTGECFAFIGKPCDVAALRNLANHDPRVNQQIPYMLAMFCGAVPSWLSTRNIVHRFGVQETEVETFRYRGHGWPGPTHVRSHSGEIHEQSYDQTWFSEMRYSLMFRCAICADGIGESADIAAGDYWHMVDGKPTHAEAIDGWNFCMARSRAGAALLDGAAEAGFLHLEPIEVASLDAMHDDHALRKRSVLWRLLGLWLTRQPTTRFKGLRVWACGLGGASMREACLGFFGMLARVIRRRSRELARPAD